MIKVRVVGIDHDDDCTFPLISVFKDGKILRTQTFDEIRELAGLN